MNFIRDILTDVWRRFAELAALLFAFAVLSLVGCGCEGAEEVGSGE